MSQFELSHLEDLSYVTIWYFEFCHNLIVWFLSPYEILSFVTSWFCWVLSQLQIWSFVPIWVIHNFKFLVLSQFEFCHNLIFLVFSKYKFCHSLSFWVLSWLEFLSLVKTWVFEFFHNLSWVLSQFEFLSFFLHNLRFRILQQFPLFFPNFIFSFSFLILFFEFWKKSDFYLVLSQFKFWVLTP